MAEDNEYTISQDASGGHSLSYTMPQRVTVESIESIHEHIIALNLNSESHLNIDVSQMQEVTTPGVQLLVSIQKTLAQYGGSFVIRGENEPLIRVFADIGLGNWFLNYSKQSG